MLASTFFLLASTLSSLTPAYAGLGDDKHESSGYRRHQRFRQIQLVHPHKHNSTCPTTPASFPSRTDSSIIGNINTVTNPVDSGQYELLDIYHGSSFFDGFNFYSGPDYTHGLVNYLSASDAKSKKLAYVQNGVVVMKVDGTTPGSKLKNGKRDSVRISSKKRYDGGLFVLDVIAMPYGNTIWPAYWTVGFKWPDDGEIDIIEGVNKNTKNQYTMHTSSGCSIDPSTLPNGLPSHVGKDTNCNSGGGHNGCPFFDPDTISYGAGLNNAGGGVFVVLWDSDVIKIWRFPPKEVPSDLKNQVPDPDSWDDSYLRAQLGDSSKCDVGEHFTQHSITFDITLCGDWAGTVYPGGKGACASAVKDLSNFKNVAWRISSVQVYR